MSQNPKSDNNLVASFTKYNESPSRNKKLISFSVYGEKATYLLGAERNYKEAKVIYPGWTCRFYCCPKIKNLQSLIDSGAEVFVVDSKIPPMYWRYFAADEPNASVAIFRDTDSLVNVREKAAVDQWLSGNKILHTMHDNDAGHWSPIMGGMCGFKLPLHFNMIEAINLWAKQRNNYRFSYSDDQSFLSQRLLPIYSNSCIDHHNSPSASKFKNSCPFPKHEPLSFGMFVGDRISVFGFLDANSFNTDSDKAFLMVHQGPRDHFHVRESIQYVIDNHKEVVIPVRKANLLSAQFLFGGHSNVKLITLNSDGPADHAYDIYMQDYQSSHKFIGFGLHSSNPKNLHWGDALCFSQMGISKPVLNFKICSKQDLDPDKAPAFIKPLISSKLNFNKHSPKRPSTKVSKRTKVSIFYPFKKHLSFHNSFRKSFLDNIKDLNIEFIPFHPDSDFVNLAKSKTYDYLLVADPRAQPICNSLSTQIGLMLESGCQISSSECLIHKEKQNPSELLYNSNVYFDTIFKKFKKFNSTLLDSGFPDILHIEFLSIHNSLISGTNLFHRDVLLKHLNAVHSEFNVRNLTLRCMQDSNLIYSQTPLYKFSSK